MKSIDATATTTCIPTLFAASNERPRTVRPVRDEDPPVRVLGRHDHPARPMATFGVARTSGPLWRLWVAWALCQVFDRRG
jgi:hypothetical protein